jgi:hypothetical protein
LAQLMVQATVEQMDETKAGLSVVTRDVQMAAQSVKSSVATRAVQ